MEERKGKNHLFFFWGCNGVYLHVLCPLSFFSLFYLFCLVGLLEQQTSF